MNAFCNCRKWQKGLRVMVIGLIQSSQTGLQVFNKQWFLFITLSPANPVHSVTLYLSYFHRAMCFPCNNPPYCLISKNQLAIGNFLMRFQSPWLPYSVSHVWCMTGCLWPCIMQGQSPPGIWGRCSNQIYDLIADLWSDCRSSHVWCMTGCLWPCIMTLHYAMTKSARDLRLMQQSDQK